MDMRVEQRSIQMVRICGCCSAEITVAGDVTLPGSLRETANVLHAGAMAVVEHAEAMQDRISVTGRVIFRVLYHKSGADKPESIEATADFTHSCDMPGAVARAEVFACAQTGPVEASVQGGRVALRTDVHLEARACSCEPTVVITGIENTQQRKETVTLRRKAAEGSTEVLLREEFALPADLSITDTLGASAMAIFHDAAGGQGRVGLAGEVTIEAVHASAVPGKPMVVTRHTIPVNQAVEIAGEDGELLDGRITVKDVAVASQDMGDGERTLRTEVLLGLEAWADKEEAADVLVDAYTTQGEDVRLAWENMTIRTGANRTHAAESGKASLLLPEGAPPLRTMLAAFAVPVMASHTQQGSRHTAEGSMAVTLIYMSEGDAPVSVRVDAPFRAAFAVHAGMEDILSITAANVEAIPITSDRAELRYVLHLDVEGTQTMPVSLVMDAAAIPGAATTKDIVLYFTQPGESAWDISRRYRIPEAELRSLNPELGDQPKPGQGLVVWRRSRA